jgi:hypothetical protein
MNFFQKIKTLGSKVQNQVDSLRNNAKEGVDVLKSVVTEIKNEIKAEEKLTLFTSILISRKSSLKIYCSFT